jgi:cytidylate kinase
VDDFLKLPGKLSIAGSNLRTQAVNDIVSFWSETPEVREQAGIMQLFSVYSSEKTMYVAEGRDMTTHLFSDADHKFFADCEEEEAARRRAEESGLPYDTVLKNIRERNHRDMNRTLHPLRFAPELGVIKIDNNGPLTESLEAMYAITDEKVAV